MAIQIRNPELADLLLPDMIAAAGPDPNAIHVNVAGEIAGIAAKAVPVAADLVVIEDSAAANAKKSVQVGNLPGGVDPNAIHDNVAGEIAAIAAKAVPVAADLIIIEDSAAANVKKSVQIGNLPVAGGHDILDGVVHTDSVADAVTKGSLIVGNTTPKWDELDVGVDTHVLTADSTQPMGIKWAAPAPPVADFTLWNPDAPPAAPSALDDEFDDSAFDLILWTEFDPAADLTLTEVEEGLRFDQITDPGDDWSGIYQAIPGGDFTITAKVNIRTLNANYSGFGLLLWDDATNVAAGLYAFRIMGQAGGPAIGLSRYTDYQTFAAGIAAATVDQVPHAYLRIRRTGTTYGFDYSKNGHGWLRLHTGVLIFVPDHFGIGITNFGLGITIRGVASLFRYKNSDIGLIGSLEGDRVDGWRA